MMSKSSKPAAGQLRVKQLSLCVALAMHSLAMAQQSSGSEALPDIRVRAQSERETTEGTGSYITKGKNKTATPLGLSLRDTPQSVSVITQQRIEDQGLRTITDVINNTTGVSVNQYETHRAQFTARGFQINNLMIDGVPTTWEQAWSSGEVMSSLALYDRVEVVRGSTGLTTGAGEPSAAVNMVRKRASSHELTGTAELGVGSWNQGRALVDVSTPFNQSKTVRGRFVAEYEQKDSWLDLAKNKTHTLFATVEADLTSSTVFIAGISRQENDPKGTMWGGIPVYFTDGTRTNWDRSKTTAADWTRWNSVYDNYYATLEHTFDNGWKASATFSRGERTGDSHLLYLYDYFAFGMGLDKATGTGLIASPGSYLAKTNQDDISVQASGPFQLWGRTHEAAFGVSYSKQSFDSDARPATTPAGSTGNYYEWDGSYAQPTWGPRVDYETSRTRQDSVYGVARFSLADPLKLVAGVRVTNYKKSGIQTKYDSVALANVYVPYSMSFTQEVIPYAGLIYDVDQNHAVYASYTDIFQPQQKRDANGNYLKPVTGKSFELGGKGAWLDGRLNGAFAIFRIEQDNLGQALGFNLPGTTPPEAAYRASSGATSEGFELELTGQISRGWNATVGYTQFTAKDAEDNDFNSIYPRKLFRVFTTYQLPGEWRAMTIGGGVNWEDSTYTVSSNVPAGGNPRIEQAAYSLVNLMARYEFTKQLSAQLNINNALDEKYVGMFDAYGAITYGAPRNATLTLRYKF